MAYLIQKIRILSKTIIEEAKEYDSSYRENYCTNQKYKTTKIMI